MVFSSRLAAGPLALPDAARPGPVRPEIKTSPHKTSPSSADIEIPATIDHPSRLAEGPLALPDAARPGPVRPEIKTSPHKTSPSSADIEIPATVDHSSRLAEGPLALPDAARPGPVRPEIKTSPHKTSPSSADIEIPAMIDRPFDIEEGPYVSVRKFRLVNAEDFPQFDISVDDVTEILEKLQKEQPERGFSIGELQQVAGKVTHYYRSKGLILSTAVLPVQTVVDGVVDIKIFIGRLGRIIAEGNEGYSENVLRRPFLGLIGQPVTQKTIESALLTLSDYPGLSVFGVFQPGQKVGEADIVLNVQEEKWYDVSYRADNHGLQSIGRNRFRTVVNWNNPSGMADRIMLTYQQSYNPKMNDYWALDYAIFLGDSYSFKIGTYKNRFEIGGELSSSQIAAETTADTLGVKKSFIRSRQENMGLNLMLDRKRSISRAASTLASQTRLTVLSLELDYDLVDTYHPFRPLINAFKKEPDDFGGGINFATLTVSRGFNNVFGAMGSNVEQLALPVNRRVNRSGGSGRLAEGQFLKLELNYQRLQLMTKNTSLLFKTELQWSKDLLTPLEQYSVGGAENVRGFPDAQGMFDRAYFLSFEYIFNAPFFADKPAFNNHTWGEVLQLSAFYDFATGQQNDALNIQQDRNTSGKWMTYRSWGLGLRFNVPGIIDSRLMYANGLGPETPNNNRGGQIWGDFTYSF